MYRSAAHRRARGHSHLTCWRRSSNRNALATISLIDTNSRRRKLRHLAIAALTLCTLLIHGYHPLAEDGGLYVAGVEYTLDHSLFPHDAAFVTAHLSYSIFSPLLAAVVRLSHIPLPWVLLGVFMCSIWTTLYAAWRIAHRSFHSERAAFTGVALLSAWFTLPIAGTSLLLMDPYVTARSVSTPLSLLAISFALDARASASRNAYIHAGVCLLAAALFHPLMTAYAAAFVIALLVAQQQSFRRRAVGWAVFAGTAIALAVTLQAFAPRETPANLAADASRYYWFLSQWRWFELLGLAGPLLVLAILRRFARPQLASAAAALCLAGEGLGAIAIVIATVFAQEHYHAHLVARLQPLRAFLLIYAVMVVLLGGVLAERLAKRRSRALALIPPGAILAMAGLMFFVQRRSFPASLHLELPWRAAANPWSQAFVWARERTAADALFALDANYITRDGEDAQTFRSTARRSVLADFSKDGGEAAITPSLAATWLAQSTAQKDLSLLDDTERDARLRPFGVTWMVLRSAAMTAHTCPYNNAVVKVCSSSPPLPPGPLRP